MTATGTNDDHLALDAATVALIERAHECSGVAAIDDHLPHQNFGSMWASLASEGADRLWMSYYPCVGEETPQTLTVGEFAESVERVAQLLAQEYGIGEGATVATLMINQPLTAAIYFAAWRLGARVVPISPEEPDQQVGEIVHDAGATLLIAHTICKDDLGPLDEVLTRLLGENLQRSVVLDGTTRDGALTAGWDDFNAALNEFDVSKTSAKPPDVHWDTEALIAYPIGVMGRPLGAVLTQKQLFAAAYGIAKWHNIDEHAVLMNSLPLHRVGEIVLSLVMPAFAGAQVVMNRHFSAKGVWKKLAEHNVTIASVVPRFLQELMESGEDFDPQTIPGFCYFISRSQPLTVDAAGEFQDRFGLKIVHGYGLDETASFSCFLPTTLDWHEHVQWVRDHEVPSVGVPMLVNDVDIHDTEGVSIGTGREGELVARGHNIMARYHGNPEANARVFRQGWLHTGYKGYKLRSNDDREYFFVTGRIE